MRGTETNPINRFQTLHLDYDRLVDDEGRPIDRKTVCYRDTSKSILAKNESPDVPFSYGLNPYRGCEHGCIYCYARPSHEYLSFSAGLDFERKIMVKPDAAVLLRKQLASAKWQPQVVCLSGNTDCYQPVERQFRLTRACLEVFAEFLNPVGIITKSALVLRDRDVLQPLIAAHAISVSISLTTLDNHLAQVLEPRAARPDRRLEAIRGLSEAGVPVNVMVAPVIPGLNDAEVPAILAAAWAAGARTAGWTLLRLPPPVDELFSAWLAEHFPLRREHVLSLIKSCRQGALSDSRFGERMRGDGQYADQLAQLFVASAKRLGFGEHAALSAASFKRPKEESQQLSLFA